CMQGIEFPMTF
nr:immunoglobulin light chain junction region [Macaca mulatta]MOW64262.1 immunoglobulin light chain junction region [Macaca mulatta]